MGLSAPFPFRRAIVAGTDWSNLTPSHDRYGNLTTVNVTQCSAPSLGLTVNSNNQITNTGFSYDLSGNMTGDGLYTYTWNAESQLTSANSVNYTYDGDRKRVQKSNGMLYWYGPSGEILEETDLSGNLLHDYIYFGGRRIARQDGTGASSVYYFFGDHLGTALVMVDAWGHVQQRSVYYPFGGERVITNTVANNYKFTGLERDSESGLDHTLNRQLSSNLGRWLSPDPVRGCVMNPQNFDRYGYVANNPTSRIDPLGDQIQIVPCRDDCIAAQAGEANFFTCVHCLGCCANYSLQFVSGCIDSCTFLLFPPIDFPDFFFFGGCVSNCIGEFVFDIDYCVGQFFSCLESKQGAVNACCGGVKPPFRP